MFEQIENLSKPEFICRVGFYGVWVRYVRGLSSDKKGWIYTLDYDSDPVNGDDITNRMQAIEDGKKLARQRTAQLEGKVAQASENEKAYRIGEEIAQGLLAGLTEPIRLEQVASLLETSFSMAAGYQVCASNSLLMLKAGVCAVMILCKPEINEVINTEVNAWVEIENRFYLDRTVTLAHMINMVDPDKSPIGVVALWRQAIPDTDKTPCGNCEHENSAHFNGLCGMCRAACEFVRAS